ncbi:MAG: phenylpyruvate tautomerase MIF-related protein [Spirochaetota bacterium]
MPFIRIHTNIEVTESTEVLKKLSSLSAEKIGKPEAYVMTALEDRAPMTFGGSDEPLAFIECKSIGLGETQTKSLSSSLCSFCEKELGIPQSRVYIEFAGARGSMWGWKGGTF